MPPTGDGIFECSNGPASFAGTSRIRFGGSVAWATLSALLRSPEAIFSCCGVYPGIRHELHNEPEGPAIIADIIAWIDGQLAVG